MKDKTLDEDAAAPVGLELADHEAGQSPPLLCPLAEALPVLFDDLVEQRRLGAVAQGVGEVCLRGVLRGGQESGRVGSGAVSSPIPLNTPRGRLVDVAEQPQIIPDAW